MKDLTDFNVKGEPGRGRARARCRSAQIFEALIKIKYPGWVDLEYEVHGDDPMPGVTESFAYMRGVLVGHGLQPTRLTPRVAMPRDNLFLSAVSILRPVRFFFESRVPHSTTLFTP